MMAKLDIKVLGAGCLNCRTLERRTRQTVIDNRFDAEVTKVEDIDRIMKYNIIATPALVINDKVVAKGMVPSVEEIKKLIENELNSLE